jgi:gag-polypeptide of LTR copia-type
MATSSPQPIQFTHQIKTILDADNYLLWKSQILALLRGHGLIYFIDGSKEPPSKTITSNNISTTNPEFTYWHQQDQLIMAWIFTSLSQPILAQMINCKTSRQLWVEINQLHNSQSMARVLELKLKLQTVKKGNATCSQYIQQVQSIADQLRSIGSDLSDQDLVLYTLQGLGTDFENFVTTISLRSGSVTMNELRSLFFSHEARQQANLASLTSSMVNLTVQKSNNDQSKSDSSSPTVCYAGNTKNSSFTPHQNQNSDNSYNKNYRGKGRGGYRGRGRGRSQASTFENTQCQICYKWGHPAHKYYHRFDITFVGEAQA